MNKKFIKLTICQIYTSIYLIEMRIINWCYQNSLCVSHIDYWNQNTLYFTQVTHATAEYCQFNELVNIPF